MQKKTVLSLPRINCANNKSLNSSTSSKLKIPPAYTPGRLISIQFELFFILRHFV